MPYLTQLAAVARRTGHEVVEVSGWKTRGHGPQPEVKGIVCHHTAGPKSGDYPSLAVVRDGRPGLDGPLSHFGIGRTGRIYVIAAGRCWHNAPSTSALHDNSSSIGIEAENTGTGQAWPAAQLDAYRKLCAELCREFKLPASRIKGHREVNVNKVDPKGIDMNTFRAAVAGLLDTKPAPKPPTQEDSTLKPVVDLGMKRQHVIPAGQRGSVPFEIEYQDPDKIHVDATKESRYPSIMPKGADQPYHATVMLELETAPAPDLVYVAFAQYERDSNEQVRDVRRERVLSDLHITSTLIRMSDKNKYRVDIVNESPAPVIVNAAYLQIAH